MNKGFFKKSEIAKQHTPRTARCGLCGLYKHCLSPKMKPTGKNKKNILVVAEAPGRKEDEYISLKGVKGTQLIGKAGQRLRKTLRKLGIDLDRDCVKTNAVICRREENKTPSDEMIECCRPNLLKTIEKYNPNLIILLGAVSIKSLLPVIWKEKIGTISRWGGYVIPCHKPNAWIAATYHPSYLLRKQDPVLDRIFEKHLRLALKHKKKPYSVPLSFNEQIEIVPNPSQAARILRGMLKESGTITFDYEANCLKPDGKGPEIVCCSICYKVKRTIAYPWQGEAIDITDKILKSSMPKIAQNIKFEDRWTRAILGHPVKNWLWDTMIAAHLLDYRPSITSLEFQSFVHFGVQPYDKHIKPYLKSTGKNRFNRIRELDLKELLLYNGLDSLLTYKLAMKQMKMFKQRRLE